jgi:hypothetical protein
MFDDKRRKYPRANYPCQLTMWLADGRSDTILANTSNIGVGGLSVPLNQSVPVGTKVDIHLSFKNSTTPFKCQGTVVRSVKESDRFYSIGIQFEPLNELKSAFLSGHVSELIDLEEKGKS